MSLNRDFIQRLQLVALFIVALQMAGCTEAILLQGTNFSDASTTEDAGETDAVTEDVTILPPENLEEALVNITFPEDGATIEEDLLHIEGTAFDDSGLSSVFVAVGPNTHVLADSNDGYRTWQIDLPVPNGEFIVQAIAYDANYRAAGPPDMIRVNHHSEIADNESPIITIETPENNSTPQHPNVLISGTAEDDKGVVRIESYVNGELNADQAVQTDTFFENWSRHVSLTAGQENEITFIAYDEFGRTGSASITLVGRAVQDSDPPLVSIETPENGTTVEMTSLDISGTASDRAGIRLVRVRSGDVDEEGTPIWGDSVLASTSNGFANWQATVDINTGAQFIEARAIDVNGLATSDQISVGNTFVQQWSEEESFTLRLREDEIQPTIRMELDRDGVNEVMTDEIQREMTLLEIDPMPLLHGTLEQTKNACGNAWQQNNSDPNHNCNLTELGQTFSGPDGTWQTSAEYGMVRILTMTPANVDVSGTSIEGLQGMADYFNIGGGFSQILSDSLGIPLTHEVIGTDALVEAIYENVLVTHPNTNDGRIPVTLYDAMSNMTTLGAFLGPNGDHPGLLDPENPPFGEVMNDDFTMIIEANSNLQWLDGLDLNQGKDYFATVVDTIGPSFDDVLEFDFTDPTRFQVTGLVQNPTLDLRFWFKENDAFVNSCSGTTSCQANMPGSPVGSNHVWSNPAWEIESLITLGGINQYGSRQFSKSYVLGAAQVNIGQEGNPYGWVEFYTLWNVGTPPKNQYIWELISEISQNALHTSSSVTIAEGNADVAFTLQDIDVGISANDMRDAMRPFLQSQASELSEMLLGNYNENNGTVDFYYRRGSDGLPYLFFIDQNDPRSISSYNYTNIGFFSDPELSEESRISSTNIAGSGDDIHHKLLVSETEEIIYIADDENNIFRLRLDPRRGRNNLQVHVSRQMR